MMISGYRKAEFCFTVPEYREAERAGKYNKDHGGPYDRGGADSYYGRPMEPHYYPLGTGIGEKIEGKSLTTEELEAYYAGYYINEEDGVKKY